MLILLFILNCFAQREIISNQLVFGNLFDTEVELKTTTGANSPRIFYDRVNLEWRVSDDGITSVALSEGSGGGGGGPVPDTYDAILAERKVRPLYQWGGTLTQVTVFNAIAHSVPTNPKIAWRYGQNTLAYVGSAGRFSFFEVTASNAATVTTSTNLSGTSERVAWSPNDGSVFITYFNASATAKLRTRFLHKTTVAGTFEGFFISGVINAPSISPRGDLAAIHRADVTSPLYFLRIDTTSSVLDCCNATQTFAGTSFESRFSPDSKWIAVSHSSATPLQMYKINSPFPSPVSNSLNYVRQSTSPMNVQPNATNLGELAWSPDSQYLAVVSATGPETVTVYRANVGDTFTKITIPVGLSGFASVNSIDWSSDGKLVAVSSTVSPFVKVFELTAPDTFVERPALAPSVGVAVTSVAWSKDMQYMAVAVPSDANTPFRIYRTGIEVVTTNRTPSIKHYYYMAQ